MDRSTDVPRDRRQREWTTLALALLASLLPSMAAAQIDCLSPARGIERPLLVQSRNVGYYGSYDLAVSSPDVKRAVIMIHGVGRNAADYYNTLVASACLAEKNGFASDPGRSGAPSCRFTYDNWRYGLEDLYPYAAAVGPEAIRERLLGRSVIVLLGMLDDDPNDDSMDTSCPASLQGPHRYARGHRLLAYLHDQFPSHHHFIVEVDDAGHSFSHMFVAPPGGPGTGSAVLFYDW